MTCYLRNGTESPQAIPCDHGAIAQGKHTGCCNPGDLCLSNGLCRAPNVNELTNYAWFFGCTDNTFTDSACGNYCDDFQTQNHELAFQCPQENTWCCNKGADTPLRDRVNRTNTDCCSVDDQLFKAPWATVIATAAYTGTPIPVATLMPGASTSSQSHSNSASAATSSTGPLDNPGFKPTGKSTSSLAIGLGVGLGGAAIIALILGWLFLRRRKGRQNNTSNELHGNNENGDAIVAEKYGMERLQEMDSKERYELHSPTGNKETGVVYGHELPSPMDGPVELPATEVSSHGGIGKN